MLLALVLRSRGFVLKYFGDYLLLPTLLQSVAFDVSQNGRGGLW